MIQQLRHAKIVFFDPLTLHHHTLSRLFTRTFFCCVTLSTSTPPTSFPIRNEILGFKEDRSRSKEISVLFHMFFFQLSTNNRKKKICLKSKTCHYCQSLVQIGSIPSKAGVPLSWKISQISSSASSKSTSSTACHSSS